jgi:hypothetical protein
MTMWDRLRGVLDRARTGASGVAQAANLKLDLRNLEGRPNRLLRTIGRRAHAQHRDGRGIPAFDAICDEIDSVEASIAEKEAGISAIRHSVGGRGRSESAAPGGAGSAGV